MSEPTRKPELSERQEIVLRAVVAGYIGEREPVGSRTVSHLISVPLSAASVRNTMAELTELGLIEKPHRSAGRVPTEQGLRLFVDRLAVQRLGSYEQRALAATLDGVPPDVLMPVTSQLLSEHTHQLGFVVRPRLDRMRVRHVSLVRLSTSRVLAVLVAESGVTHPLVMDDDAAGGQAELDRIASILNERGSGHTLAEIRARIADEASALRRHAERLLERAIQLAQGTVDADGIGSPAVDELVIATRLALLDQPEFHDPSRIRQLFEAVEARETLVHVLDKMLGGAKVQVAFGGEFEEPELQQLALVTAPYKDRQRPLGLVGVIGPSRMDYARVIPLVECVSELVTERLSG